MNYGFYIAGSGLTSSLYRMDVASHNLSNINTAGFKPQLAEARQRDAARIEDGLMQPANRLLERLGAGVHLMPNRTSFAQGPIQPGAGPLDAAIQGDGFFVVSAGPSAGGATHLTRDGRFTRDAGGRLVQASTGRPVLDDTGLEIDLPAGVEAVIHGDGTITQGATRVARLALLDTPNRQGLRPLGDGRFEASPELARTLERGRGEIRGGMIEQSAVDPIEAMMDVTNAGRDAERAAGLLSSFDRVMERAINGLGRVN
jgi:flagellar basal body rod protein FlgG